MLLDTPYGNYFFNNMIGGSELFLNTRANHEIKTHAKFLNLTYTVGMIFNFGMLKCACIPETGCRLLSALPVEADCCSNCK